MEAGSTVETDRARILVVDDEPTLRMSFGFALQTEGYQVDTAENGCEAIQILEAEGDSVDAMILDLRMPGMGGLDVLTHLKNQDIFVPTIILSAGLDSPTAVRAIELGVTDFLRKPVTPSDLRSMVSRILTDEDSESLSPTLPDPALPRMRWSLRRRDLSSASEVLSEIPESEHSAETRFWNWIVSHLSAVEKNEDTEAILASGSFYKATNLLDLIAGNRVENED